MYKDNIEMIKSECMTFFLAGSQGSANLNALVYTLLNPEVHKKVMTEIREVIGEGDIDI